MTRFSGTEAILDRARRILEESGEPSPLAPLAASVLQTSSRELASRVFHSLIESDPRFLVRGNMVRLAKAEDPFGALPAEEVPLAVLDFETNGFPPSERAIEVGVVCFQGGEETAHLSTLLDPGGPVSSFVQRLTGIRQEDLRGKPSFEQAWPELSPLLRGRVLTAHNLPFDRRVLHRELDLSGIPERPAHTFCTLRFARKLFKKSHPGGLDALAHRFGLEFEARHRALDDARVAGRVFYRLLNLAREEVDLVTWGDLEEFLRPSGRRTARFR